MPAKQRPDPAAAQRKQDDDPPLAAAIRRLVDILAAYETQTNGSSPLDRRLHNQSSDSFDVWVRSGHDLGCDRDRQAHRSGGVEDRGVSCSGWLSIVVPQSCCVEFIRVGLKPWIAVVELGLRAKGTSK
jgi:hypothetical protein